MAEHDPVSEATQNKQTTRFQYPRGDAVISKFFASNVYKSAALIDVIYLFHLDYGADADVSQILRERLMDSARSNGAATPTPPATKRSVAMPDVTDNTESVDVDDKSDKQPEKQSAQESAEKSAEKTAAPDESESNDAAAGEETDTAAKDTDTAAEKKSNTDTKSSDFNIAEMFD